MQDAAEILEFPVQAHHTREMSREELVELVTRQQDYISKLRASLIAVRSVMMSADDWIAAVCPHPQT